MKDAAISRRDRPSSQCGSERRARPKKGKGNGSKSDSDSESVRQGDAQTAATDSRQTRRKICFSFRICIVQHSQIHTRISQRRCQGQSQLLPFDCLYFHAQLHSTPFCRSRGGTTEELAHVSLKNFAFALIALSSLVKSFDCSSFWAGDKGNGKRKTICSEQSLWFLYIFF